MSATLLTTCGICLTSSDARHVRSPALLVILAAGAIFSVSWRRALTNGSPLIAGVLTNQRAEKGEIRSLSVQPALHTVVGGPALTARVPPHLDLLLLLLRMVLDMLPQAAGVSVPLVTPNHLTLVRFL